MNKQKNEYANLDADADAAANANADADDADADANADVDADADAAIASADAGVDANAAIASVDAALKMAQHSLRMNIPSLSPVIVLCWCNSFAEVSNCCETDVCLLVLFSRCDISALQSGALGGRGGASQRQVWSL